MSRTFSRTASEKLLEQVFCSLYDKDFNSKKLYKAFDWFQSEMNK